MVVRYSNWKKAESTFKTAAWHSFFIVQRQMSMKYTIQTHLLMYNAGGSSTGFLKRCVAFRARSIQRQQGTNTRQMDREIYLKRRSLADSYAVCSRIAGLWTIFAAPNKFPNQPNASFYEFEVSSIVLPQYILGMMIFNDLIALLLIQQALHYHTGVKQYCYHKHRQWSKTARMEMTLLIQSRPKLKKS